MSLKNKIQNDRMIFKSVEMNDKYQGMNYYANKELHTGYDIKENEILLDKHLTREEKVNTIKHELIERRLMSRGMKYREADKIASRYG